MDFSTTLRIILICVGIGLFGGLLALIISLIFSKASRLLALIPGLLLLVLAIASAVKAAFFSSAQTWDDLGFAVMAILLGGGALVALLCGLIIILVRKKKAN